MAKRAARLHYNLVTSVRMMMIMVVTLIFVASIGTKGYLLREKEV